MEALPSNVRRTVGSSSMDKALVIAAEGPRDELAVHSDQLKEYFANPKLKLADAIAEPGETPAALFECVRAQLA